MEIEPHKLLSITTFANSINSRGFLEFATPSLHYNFVVIILHVLNFYPAQVTQLVEYEGSSPFEVVGSSPTLRPI